MFHANPSHPGTLSSTPLFQQYLRQLVARCRRVASIRLRQQERVRLHSPEPFRVVAQQPCDGRFPQLIQLTSVKPSADAIFKEEPIARPRTPELLEQDAQERWSNGCTSRPMILQRSGHRQLHIVHRVVPAGQPVNCSAWNFTIQILPSGSAPQSTQLPEVVIAGKSMVPGPVYIDRLQIGTVRVRVPEEKVFGLGRQLVVGSVVRLAGHAPRQQLPIVALLQDARTPQPVRKANGIGQEGLLRPGFLVQPANGTPYTWWQI